MVVQAVKSAGARVVAGFASLDRQLQKAGILPELKPVKLPEEVRDESGQLASDCAEVRSLLSYSFKYPQTCPHVVPPRLSINAVWCRFATSSRSCSSATRQ